MKITQENLLAHELIGLSAEIVDSKHVSLKNMRGKIVYETKNLLLLSTHQKITKVPKSTVVLLLRLPDGNDCVINGSDLVGRPEDRIQRLS